MSARLLLGCALLAVASTAAQGAALRTCEAPPEMSAAQHDRLLRVAAVVKAELAQSGASVALVARSGLDLSRFQVRYSHAGISLQASADTPWAVRQLYFACDERRPRLYDQGMAAFVLGTNAPALGYVSMLLLPQPQAALLEHTALDQRQALALLGAAYSANAYPFSVQYQNCNQWLAELLATAWGGAADADTDDDRDADSSADASVNATHTHTPTQTRSQAQAWLRQHGYVPSVFDVGPWMLLAGLVPYVHGDDHPAADLRQHIYRVSMPASIEAFVHDTLAAATRIEVCHTDKHIVVHRGWDPVDDGCVPGPQDTLLPLD